MKIADGELRQILTHDLKLPAGTVRELVADSRQTGRTLLQTTLVAKTVTDLQIARAHAKRLGVPLIDLEENPAPEKTILMLPRQIAARYKVICFDKTKTSVKIAMTDPRSEQARKALRDYFGKTIRRYQATDRGLRLAMQAYIKNDTSPLPLSTRELLITILEQADRNGSRDLHFEPQDNELVIKRRAGKQLRTLTTLPIKRYVGLLSWCKVQSNINPASTEQAHHGRFAVRIDGVLHTVIISTVPVVNGEKMLLRLVPPTDSIPSLAAIGYAPKDIDYIENCLKDGRGLIIVAGGNGSDVPTTLARIALTAAQLPNTTVSTIEQPIHYQIRGATQVEATHALPFSDIVSAVVTQNPSTIVAANLGNGSSVEQLVDFSLSHLVVSGAYGLSLHSVIMQLMSYPIAPALMAASLRLIIVQHQIETLCKYCRISFVPRGPLKTALWEQFGFANETRLYRKGEGCSNCHKGHHGTTLVTEWLPNNPELQQLMATGADAKAITAYIKENSNYVHQLAKQAAKGSISIDEATERVAA